MLQPPEFRLFPAQVTWWSVSRQGGAWRPLGSFVFALLHMLLSLRLETGLFQFSTPHFLRGVLELIHLSLSLSCRFHVPCSYAVELMKDSFHNQQTWCICWFETSSNMISSFSCSYVFSVQHSCRLHCPRPHSLTARTSEKLPPWDVMRERRGPTVAYSAQGPR